ncbi:MAG TPA: hypothetical protein VFF65_00435, partial [Phycisphaerales bacterium]|nr:hypothetical protein [Phycisphaerales bacterium]
MNSETKIALRDAVLRYGPELGSDARRCRAVLVDFCPRQKRDVRVLTAAVEEGIPDEIMSRGTTVPRSVLTESLARRLFEHQGIELEIARWSVGCWMDALAGQKAGAARPAGGAGGAGMSASGTGAPGPKVAP